MLNVLDLFSGIGGFSLGLESTGGFRTVAFCEIDGYATRVLNKHWPDVPVFSDVRTLGFAELMRRDIPIPDIVCGGFPCQDISTAGRGAGLDGERSGLWFEMLRVIDETRPKFVIAENVAVLRSRGLDTCLRGLASIGYDAEWHCLPAASVGAPHRRDRVWIVAHAQRVRCATAAQPRGDTEPYIAGEDYIARDADIRSGNVAHTKGDGRSEGRGFGDGVHSQTSIIGTCELARSRNASGGWWAVEPDVGRVVDGVPSRVDRLRCLGNAVVPQIPALIGQAILRACNVSSGKTIGYDT